MLKAVYFVKNTGASAARYSAGTVSEMERSVRALRGAGFESGILCAGVRGEGCLPAAPGQMEEALFLCDSPELLSLLRSQGYRAAGYLHAENEDAVFSGSPYLVQEPDLVDADSYRKIYEREAGLPWTILETPRCLVREFAEEDLDALYSLYDEEARRFLEPPSEDRALEREILRAYIRRIYSLYGFGHWAVIEKPGADTGERPGEGHPGRPGADTEELPGEGHPGRQTSGGPGGPGKSGKSGKSGMSGTGTAETTGTTGTLIGRIGFAAITADQEKEALELGVRGDRSREDSGIDADFGFLVAASRRGRGIAEEVCQALLEYGFTQLGFTRVRADARLDNAASLRLLDRLGFRRIGIVTDTDPEDGGEREGAAGQTERAVFLREAPRQSAF